MCHRQLKAGASPGKSSRFTHLRRIFQGADQICQDDIFDRRVNSRQRIQLNKVKPIKQSETKPLSELQILQHPHITAGVHHTIQWLCQEYKTQAQIKRLRRAHITQGIQVALAKVFIFGIGQTLQC